MFAPVQAWIGGKGMKYRCHSTCLPLEAAKILYKLYTFSALASR